MIRTCTNPPRHHDTNLIFRKEVKIEFTWLIVSFDVDHLRSGVMHTPFRHIPDNLDGQSRMPLSR